MATIPVKILRLHCVTLGMTKEQKSMYLLSAHVIPNASKTEIVGWHEGSLKIRLAAPPVEGKANDELRRFLGKILDIAPSLIGIEKGMSSKKKRIRLPMMEADFEEVIANCLKI